MAEKGDLRMGFLILPGLVVWDHHHLLGIRFRRTRQCLDRECISRFSSTSNNSCNRNTLRLRCWGKLNVRGTTMDKEMG